MMRRSPILDIAETPEAIDVVLINRPDLAPTGSGEPSIRPVAAAIANTILTRPACASGGCRSRLIALRELCPRRRTARGG